MNSDACFISTIDLRANSCDGLAQRLHRWIYEPFTCALLCGSLLEIGTVQVSDCRLKTKKRLFRDLQNRGRTHATLLNDTEYLKHEVKISAKTAVFIT